MEQRMGTISIGSSGGTAGGAYNNYKVTLPSAWVKELGLSPENRQIVLTFDGTSIGITKQKTLPEFLTEGRKQGHRLLLLSCYDGDTLCARIAADETAHSICTENLVTDFLKLPFGNNRFPDWEDYTYFLESRCIPDSRAGLREYLEAIGVDHFAPIEILRKTGGKMAEDSLWLTVEDIS